MVLNDAVARDLVLPVELRGRPLGDLAVIDVLETWASAQAASILAGLFLVAAVVLAPGHLADDPHGCSHRATRNLPPSPDDAAERASHGLDVVA